MAVGGGLPRALARAEERGYDVMQIFPSNPRGWAVPALDPRSDEVMREALEERGWPLFLHAPYLEAW